MNMGNKPANYYLEYSQFEHFNFMNNLPIIGSNIIYYSYAVY